MIGRAKVPPADPDRTRLLQLTAVHDQAVAAIDDGLRAHGQDRRTADVLLDVRLLLRPPEPVR